MKIAVCVKYVPVVSRIRVRLREQGHPARGSAVGDQPLRPPGPHHGRGPQGRRRRRQRGGPVHGPAQRRRGPDPVLRPGRGPRRCCCRTGRWRAATPWRRRRRSPFGVAKRESRRPHRVRTQQQRRRNRSGGTGNRRTHGAAPHQQRAQAGRSTGTAAASVVERARPTRATKRYRVFRCRPWSASPRARDRNATRDARKWPRREGRSS